MHSRSESRRSFFESTAYREVLERLAANVQRVRAARGWTQEECCAQCGDLDITLLRAIEAARANVTAATVARLCEGLGVDVSEFYDSKTVFVRRGPGRPRRERSPDDVELSGYDQVAAQERLPPDLVTAPVEPARTTVVRKRPPR